MNIEITINADALAGAISELAGAIRLHAEAQTRIENGEIVIPAGTPLTVKDVEPVDIVEAPEPAAKQPKARKKAAKQQAPAETSQNAPSEPVADTAPAAPAEPEKPAEKPVEAPAATVPTKAEIATAGARLLDKDPNVMQALLTLLGDYGVQAITQLKDDQLAGFAAKLRELGAEV